MSSNHRRGPVDQGQVSIDVKLDFCILCEVVVELRGRPTRRYVMKLSTMLRCASKDNKSTEAGSSPPGNQFREIAMGNMVSRRMYYRKFIGILTVVTKEEAEMASEVLNAWRCK